MFSIFYFSIFNSDFWPYPSGAQRPYCTPYSSYSISPFVVTSAIESLNFFASGTASFSGPQSPGNPTIVAAKLQDFQAF